MHPAKKISCSTIAVLNWNLNLKKNKAYNPKENEAEMRGDPPSYMAVDDCNNGTHHQNREDERNRRRINMSRDV
jgi:hypothetical protein